MTGIFSDPMYGRRNRIVALVLVALVVVVAIAVWLFLDTVIVLLAAVAVALAFAASAYFGWWAMWWPTVSSPLARLYEEEIRQREDRSRRRR